MVLSSDCCVTTLARPREQHLRLQPDHPIGVHHCCGCGVWQTDQVLPLLLLHQVHDETRPNFKKTKQ